MQLVIDTAPTLYPITLAELKLHLKVDSGTFAGNIVNSQSIAPGSHATTTGYALEGTAIEVIGKQAMVSLVCGTNGATGTVDAKIQESDNGSTWNDWTGGAFTQVTTVTNNATYEKAYTGIKRYIRVVAKVLLAACEFGADVIVNEATTFEDDDLEDLILEATDEIEKITRRKLLTQTWKLYLDEFPCVDYIKIPFGNLQEINSIKYTDVDGTETTLTETTDYLEELNGEGLGRIVLPYGITWPTDTLHTSNPIVISFDCGWTAAASVPKLLKRAVKLKAEDMYYHGDRADSLQPVIYNLCQNYRLWDEF
jgi:uncharacterized phiE125 gp8 family phage protein